MNFTDTIKVQALHYEPNYAVVGDKAFVVDEDGNITATVDDEKTAELLADGEYDENGDPIEPAQTWVMFGKEKNAIIFPNSRANKMSLADGKEFVYSYEVIVKLKKALYPLLPKQGDRVWLHKSDDTINKDMEVKGFVTLKQRYLKLWL